jgi:hypothetical protein
LRVRELETRALLSTSAVSGIVGPAPLPPGQAMPIWESTSTNWSGYAAQLHLNDNTADKGTVSQVVGSWVVPRVSGTGTRYSSVWVGIDGWSNNTVEQLGTEQDLSGGTPTYYSWYEMYPAGSVTIHQTTRPGDAMTASVTWNGGTSFTLSMTDVTRNWTFTINKSSSSAKEASAEWIVEAPSGFQGVLPLADFGKVKWSAAAATILVSGVATTGPIDDASWQKSPVTMVNASGTKEARPSGLIDTTLAPVTSSFTVTYLDGTAAPVSGGGAGFNSASSAAQQAVALAGLSARESAAAASPALPLWGHAAGAGAGMTPAYAGATPPGGPLRLLATTAPVMPGPVAAGVLPALSGLPAGRGSADSQTPVAVGGTPSTPSQASALVSAATIDHAFVGLDETAAKALAFDAARVSPLPGPKEALPAVEDGAPPASAVVLAGLAAFAAWGSYGPFEEVEPDQDPRLVR